MAGTIESPPVGSPPKVIAPPRSVEQPTADDTRSLSIDDYIRQSYARLPAYEDLPETDGSMVENFQEPPQAMLLTESIRPYLERRYPDQRFLIGHDSGIYWRAMDPPLDGCKSPDWYLVLGVPKLRKGLPRRCYVMWEEPTPPVVAIEFVSGTGAVERDATPETGKFWVYEQGMRIPYYAIFDGFRSTLEVFQLDALRYRRMEPNSRGRYLVAPLGLELGLWHEEFMGMTPWVRWYDESGELLMNGHETAIFERARADAERARADAEKEARSAAETELSRLRELLKAKGIDPSAAS